MILTFWWHFTTHDIGMWTCIIYLHNEEHLKTLVYNIVNMTLVYNIVNCKNVSHGWCSEND